MIPRTLLSLFLALAAMAAPAQQEELLDPAEAFQLEVEAVDGETVEARWSIAEGYYLYRDKVEFRSETEGIELGTPDLPAGKIKQDEFFGEMAIYRGEVAVTVPLQRAADAPETLDLMVASQGCNEPVGICYPPQRQKVSLDLPAAAAASGNGGLPGLGGDEPLDPDQAFRFEAEVVDGHTLRAHWAIAPDHYLYRSKVRFELTGAEGVRLGAVELPAGEQKQDEFFGEIQVFHDQLEVDLPLVREGQGPTPVTLKTGFQGCNERLGICYPPINKETNLELPAAGAIARSGGTDTTQLPEVPPVPEGEASQGTGQKTPQAAQPPLSEQDSLARSLAQEDTLLTLGTFFGLGLLLAFTPCVFPMIPILSSIIAGQGATLTTGRAFSMSLVYVLAMAATYTAAGVIAALLGANIQAAFQDPWVLSAFAAVFVLLALSMFGFYDLQLPAGLQSRLTAASNRQQGGSLAGVAVMGLLSALIVGPCVAPPLMGALIYISQTGDPWLGGTALFFLSLGMGAPLLLIGTSAGKLLPRAGGWMEVVKAVFGVLLLAVAVYLLERILPGMVVMVLWALLFLVSAIYMGALEPLTDGASGWRRLWKGLGVVLLIYGALLLIGAASGGKDPLAPLGHMRLAGAGGAPQEHLQFRRVKTVDELQAQVAAASARNQPVMLDFYADWCVSCKEFDKYTFSDPGVQQALEGTLLLQADVTANDAKDKALLQHFDLIGPPAILFWGPEGSERQNYRVVGFMDAEAFRAHVEAAL